MAAAHVGSALALGRLVAEVTKTVDHLLRRTAADAELQASAGNDVGGTRIFCHVERVFVAHVDDAGADLDVLGLCADGGQQRKRRGELAGIVVDTEIGAVGPQFLCRHGKVDRLHQHVRRRPRGRLRGGVPVAEGEKADFLHDMHSSNRFDRGSSRDARQPCRDPGHVTPMGTPCLRRQRLSPT
jgi:hypothetical protein